MALLKLKIFLCPWTASYFYGFIYIYYAAPPYSAVISAIYRLPFGEVCVPFADLRVRRLAIKKNAQFTVGA